jgi:hypothetical protein
MKPYILICNNLIINSYVLFSEAWCDAVLMQRPCMIIGEFGNTWDINYLNNNLN